MGKHLNDRNFDWEAFKRGEISRICPNCQTPRFSNDFLVHRSKKHGFDHHCKICTAVRLKLHRENNRQRYRDLNNKWKRDHPNSVKTWHQIYYAEHREQILEKDRLWRTNNIEKNRARQREFNRIQPWQYKAAANCNSRALEKGLPRGMKGDDLLDPKTGTLPIFCPIFPHIRLDYNHGSDRRLWASVDKIVPELGYTTGNVWVISMAANTWKSNGSNPSERAKISKLMTQKKTKTKISESQIPLF